MNYIATSVSRETMSKIDRAKAMILDEARRQNLIAASTVPDFDVRHIVDSLQLIPYIRDERAIVDIGSGGGIPGLILALAIPNAVHLVEPRAKRSAFLEHAVEHLDLSPRVVVHSKTIQRVTLTDVGTIVARAVAPLEKLLAMAAHLIGPDTRWVLPKGRNAHAEVAQALRTWQGDFRIVPSQTADDSAIVIAEHIRRRQVA